MRLGWPGRARIRRDPAGERERQRAAGRGGTVQK